MKHTPGPWNIDAETVYVVRVNIGEENRYKLLEYVLVSGDNSKANALLIAAAPDLLEALEGLTSYCDKIEQFKFCNEMRIAVETIKKAKGQ